LSYPGNQRPNLGNSTLSIIHLPEPDSSFSFFPFCTDNSIFDQMLRLKVPTFGVLVVLF